MSQKLSSGDREKGQDERHQLMARVLLCSIGAMLFFALIHWMKRCCYSLAAIELGLSAVLAVMYWLLRRGASLQALDNALMAGAVILFGSLVVAESIEGSGAYWVGGFPFVAYFIKEAKQARYWVGAFALALLVLAIVETRVDLPLDYSAAQLACMLAVVLFLWLFADINKSQLDQRQVQLEQANAALDAEQRKLRAILDHAPIGIWMLDETGKPCFFNRHFAELLNLDHTDAAAADLYAMRPQGAAAAFAAMDRECLQRGGTFYGRTSFDDANGETRTFDLIRVCFADEAGKTAGLVGFAIDITERLKAEEEQKQHEQRLEHAQRLESLGLMAGGIAHDFNNILTVVRGNLDLALADDDLGPTMRERLEAIGSASQAAADLCRQMLVYSGKGVMQPELIDPCSLVEEMRPLLMASVDKRVTMDFDLQKPVPLIRGDRAQIRQVLLNLVMNASEAITPNAGTIQVLLAGKTLSGPLASESATAPLDAGDYLLLQVRDDGCGMDEETRGRMFDPFFTTKFTGRGLGMSAVLGILRAHQAAMVVDSAPGKGTTMQVWIPCETAELTSRPAPTAAAQPGSRLAGRVLLVDDEAPVIDVARKMLERLGFEVSPATSAREALAAFAEDPDGFDWVLLDVTMPGMSGIECLEHLRGIRPDVHVVLSSGYTVESVLQDHASARPDDFLTKPYTLRSLQEVAHRAMRIESM